MPSSTLPNRGIAPARNSTCSASVVLPLPAWPASTTLRMWARSWLFNVIARGSSRYAAARPGFPAAGGTVAQGGRLAMREPTGRRDARAPNDVPVGPMIVGILRARCPDIPSGPRSSARRASTTPSAAPCSPRSRARSPSPRAPVAVTPTPTTACASRSTRRARSTCRPTTSSGRSRRRRAAGTRSSTRRSSTRATAPAASRSSSRPPPTTATARRPRSAPSSPRPAASSPAAARSRGSSRLVA